ncbi:ribonuclease HI [Gemella sp. ND 6198]|uniref:ribonuclease H1 domain-containing protein n=1 Tax=Gemella sp. ND 6198 TaxID=2040624 RepID=UPI000E0CAF77|nr:ribonuclease H family protein [Gemella sp. ND 6198]AXI26289.1 ribonuclease HI [Gemella sp. ND 6198]
MVKYYAVSKGRKVGIFLTWDECKEQVHGYKGAVFKSFSTREEAENFLTAGNMNKEVEAEKINGFYAYIDGSFDKRTGVYGSGIVIVNNDKKYQTKLAGNDRRLARFHNVAGEIEAAKFVTRYAKENKIPEITLFYDYQGIESWVSGAWKANLAYTQHYAQYMNKLLEVVKVNFVKVKAHSGVRLNELADKLAKQAIEEFKIKNNI